ncbi:MAG: sulfatase [Phycisphaerales bacterium]
MPLARRPFVSLFVRSAGRRIARTIAASLAIATAVGGTISAALLASPVAGGAPAPRPATASAATSTAGDGDVAPDTLPAVPPNIVVFLVDDMGWQDTSVPFGPDPTPLNARYRTPAMQRLAGEGMRWTDAYATPICSPSRISMITGLNAARHMVTSWTLRRGQSTDAKHPRLTFPAWNVNGLVPAEDAGPAIPRSVRASALPARLRAAGYHTIHVGKAHFAAMDTPAADPTAIGFNVNIAGHAAGAPGSYHGEHHYAGGRRRGQPEQPSVWDVPGLADYHGTDVNLTEALTREAIAALRDAAMRDAPFFLHLSHYAVHTPIMPDARYVEAYDALDATEAAYASMVEAMDRSLADVLAELDRLELASNTLVVFFSDNGGLSDHARGGERNTHNRPLSNGKGSAREGGSRVPMLVRWPGVVAAGSTTGEPMIAEDLFTTILAAAGASAADDDRIDGRDLGAVLRDAGASLGERPFVWHLPNMWAAKGPGYGPASWIRLGDWKLIHYHDPEHAPRFELFNLTEDLGETRSRAREQPEIAQRLATALTEALRARGAMRSIRRDTGEPVAWPDAGLAAWLDEAATREPTAP